MGTWIREQLWSVPESHPRNCKHLPRAAAVSLSLLFQCVTVTSLGPGSRSRVGILSSYLYLSLTAPFTRYLSIVISVCSYLRFNFLSKLTFWALYDPSLAKDLYNWIAAVMFCMPKFPNSKASAIFSIAFKFPMSAALAKSM